MPNMTIDTQDVFRPDLWEKSVLEFLKSNLVLADLVSRYDDRIASEGKALNIQFNTELAANNKIAGIPTSAQAPTDEQVTLLIDQHKETTIVVESILEAQANISIMQLYTKDITYPIVKAIDASLASLVVGFNNSVGSFFTAITTDVFLDAILILDDDDVPATDRHFIFRPDSKRNLLDISTYTSADFISGRPVESGKVAGMLYGVQTHMSTNILKSGDETSNILMHRDALALGIQKGPRVNSDYVPREIGWVTVADAIFGVLGQRNDHGVQIRT